MAYIELKPNILDKIKDGRAINSDEDMARMIGVSPETYGRVKRGEQAPSQGFLAALALRFMMPFDTLAHAVEGEAPTTYKRTEKVAS